MSEPDFAALGLLDGLEDEDARAARLALLEALHADGVETDELREAVDDGRLALVPAERALGGAPTLTPREVAEQAGIDLEAFEAIRRACGLPLPGPDARELGELDLAGARTLKEFIAGGLPLDGLVQASRVFGEAAAHAAAAAGTLANRTIPRAGDTEHDYAVRLAQAAAALTPLSSELLGLLYQLHTRATCARRSSRPRRSPPGGARMCTRSASASATWSASRGWARACRPRISARSRHGSRRSPQRPPSRRCGS